MSKEKELSFRPRSSNDHKYGISEGFTPVLVLETLIELGKEYNRSPNQTRGPSLDTSSFLLPPCTLRRLSVKVVLVLLKGSYRESY